MVMRTLVRVIDSISEGAGNVGSWAVMALILVLGVKVFARYLFHEPTIWSYETASMLGVTIAYIGWSYTLRHHGHVRVDVFYVRLSRRQQALVDVLLTLLLFFPLVFVLVYYSADKAWFAWSISERLMETNWYPPAFPIRAVMVVGFSLLVLQGLAQFTRDLYLLVRNKPYD